MFPRNLFYGQAKSVSVLTHLFHFVALSVVRSTAYVLLAAFVERPGRSSSVPRKGTGNPSRSDLPRSSRNTQILYCFVNGDLERERDRYETSWLVIEVVAEFTCGMRAGWEERVDTSRVGSIAKTPETGVESRV